MNTAHLVEIILQCLNYVCLPLCDEPAEVLELGYSVGQVFRLSSLEGLSGLLHDMLLMGHSCQK